MSEKIKDQNNTSDEIMMYKQIPFNMTLAKHIVDGSVTGRIYAMYGGLNCEVITYVKSLGSNEVFEIELPSPIGCTEVTFGQSGMSTETVCHNALRLYIEIPVENSCEEEVAGSNIIEQEEDFHYHKCKIEPIEYILANNLGFCEGNVVKYITRYKDKGGVDDLRKIKEYVDYLIKDLLNSK